jgi:tRNA-specific 2-thiouridylase
MWSDESIPCQFKEDRRDALRVADKLGIPFETWDLTEEYRNEVVHYMIREYAAGRTPNPDVMCNRKIKFGVFLQKALARGADFIATGHYVRRAISVERLASSKKESPNAQRSTLHVAEDKNKDQSYFLWTLTQDQLKHCLFPIGEYTKPQVRELAKKFGLSTAEKPDSQGICFIGEIDLNNYLKRYIPETHGRMVTTAGRDIGEHDGLAFYTIGQREGLKIGGGIPYYVAKKDFQTNTLVVACGPFDEQLFSSVLTAYDAHWILGQEPEFPLKCKARIRYRQPLQDATVKKGADNEISVVFDEPQRAVTPGQSVVWYHNDEMLGGACIS